MRYMQLTGAQMERESEVEEETKQYEYGGISNLLENL